jgi:hypothetical protein
LRRVTCFCRNSRAATLDVFNLDRKSFVLQALRRHDEARRA